MDKRLEISDDSGFIGLVNSELYQSFVHEDWELGELLQRFKSETNAGHAVIWSTGVENFQTVEFLFKKSDRVAFREVYTNLKVTNGKLYLTNYEDLSMAAQYEDELIPSNHNSDLEIQIENGNYEVIIRQLFDPNDYDWEAVPNPCFEVVLNRIEWFQPNEFDTVIWRRET